MPLQPGDRLGPYEIRALIGSGGMGEVYRAHDPRLQRDVAVKVLTGETADDPGLRQRFEVEARAASTINHPNIVAVYDFGEHFGFLYIVWELVEGKTLRGTKFTARQTAEVGAQIADGLAAAHSAGIIHRDLKPENIIITKDGRAKILDFGLAKRTSPGLASRSHDDSPFNTQSQPGMMLGTIGYMAPEQIRAKDVDTRSDIFSLGLVLYEMIAGHRAFGGDSAVAVLNGILSKDPPDLGPEVPLSIRQIITHCIEKNPELRYQSARDLAFALRSLTGSTVITSGVHITLHEPTVALYKRREFLVGAAGALTTVGAFLVGRGFGPAADSAGTDFQQLTFDRGSIFNARFTPDGQGVAYGAAWRGAPSDVFTTPLSSSDPKPLGVRNCRLLSLSVKGELAVATDARPGGPGATGTLARVPLSGGTPQPVQENVIAAEWDPKGDDLAFVRNGGTVRRLEYPVGKVRHETPGAISCLRFSPDGTRIAFVDHPGAGDERGVVQLLELTSGAKTQLAERQSVHGLAWTPGGKEIWFSGAQKGSGRNLEAVTVKGKPRTVLPLASPLSLKDIAADGRLLATAFEDQFEMIGFKSGDQKGIELGWLGNSSPRDLSSDGLTLAFTEAGGGNGSAACIRKTDGSVPVRLGDGEAQDLSEDGQRLLALVPGTPPQFVTYSTSAGEAQRIPAGVTHPAGALFLSDGKRFVFSGGMTPGPEGSQLWLQDLTGGSARSISQPGVSMNGRAVSPRGDYVAATGLDGKLALYPVEGGAPRPVTGALATDWLIQWSGDGKSLFVVDRTKLASVRIERLDTASGKRELFKELTLLDSSGIERFDVVMSADLSMIVLGVWRRLGVLQLARGLR